MKTTLFLNNTTQAVRIPREIAFPDDTKQVEIRRVGNQIVIEPSRDTWAEFFAQPIASADFMLDREQPEDQTREPIE